MAYADYAYYAAHGGTAPEEVVSPRLEAASDDVDALTFSRINGIGFDNLTPFQQDKVRQATCLQADFLYENADAVGSAMRRYSINGVSMEFGNDALYGIVGGVAVSNAAMALLRQTGLTSRMLTRREVEPCAGRRW